MFLDIIFKHEVPVFNWQALLYTDIVTMAETAAKLLQMLALLSVAGNDTSTKLPS